MLPGQMNSFANWILSNPRIFFFFAEKKYERVQIGRMNSVVLFLMDIGQTAVFIDLTAFSERLDI